MISCYYIARVKLWTLLRLNNKNEFVWDEFYIGNYSHEVLSNNTKWYIKSQNYTYILCGHKSLTALTWRLKYFFQYMILKVGLSGRRPSDSTMRSRIRNPLELPIWKFIIPRVFWHPRLWDQVVVSLVYMHWCTIWNLILTDHVWPPWLFWYMLVVSSSGPILQCLFLFFKINLFSLIAIQQSSPQESSLCIFLLDFFRRDVYMAATMIKRGLPSFAMLLLNSCSKGDFIL